MAQNIYDQPDFFAGYSRLGRSVHGLAGAAEWPAIRALLPDLAGKRIVDLGCGFGWFARWARAHGAATVLGLDLSQNMIARARADTDDAAITYRIADLERLELPAASFDLAYSSLVFHYLEDFGRLARTVHRALVPGAPFVFTIEHPIYMAPTRPGWAIDASGRKTWPVDRYAVEGPRTTDWLAEGVVKQHRRLGTTLNTLIGSGFAIRHVEEWAPTDDQVRQTPALAEEMERPMILIVSAQR
ncbi:class I SAM-dependent methyltransferase [Vineibacter terrae]|uniref:Class I SAM-dependent methyltransferase n=1 Tax=Vineibacter terrae TaxID=2586908 RepID=A0A5C8PFW5_9HYPH|nr:class I SAM-dependent methyltransferase [Vineibacter terrae]TXL72672.1 class I SAM-dependent methyltransferase [Vineibacter terrae]